MAYLSKFDSHKALAGFVAIHSRMTDSEYWETLESVWTGMEFAAPDFDTWAKLFFETRERAGAAAMMNSRERAKFKALPNTVTVYRGQQNPRHRLGFSWTLSQERARWFAVSRGEDRMRALSFGVWAKGSGVVFKGVVKKSDVLCYLNSRREEELVVHPSAVTRIARLENK